MTKNTKNIIELVALAAIILTTVFVLRFYFNDRVNENFQLCGKSGEDACLNQDEVFGFKECLEAGYPVMESYPRQCKTPDGQTFTEDIGNELEKIDLIKINNPRPNQEISSPLIVSGQARGTWFFEASFPVKLFDGDGKLLAVIPAQAKGDWMTENFVSFEAKLDFVSPATDKGLLVLEKDNPSGLPENDDRLIVPIRFDQSQNAGTTKVSVYLGNNNLDPEITCVKVFPVERSVPKTQAPARAALEELLQGVLPHEENGGYFTSLNPNVKIQSLNIENGIARVDFDEQLQFQAGGSCRVLAIRAQITETLKQFPTVNEVIISINGQTEDILQP